MRASKCLKASTSNPLLRSKCRHRPGSPIQNMLLFEHFHLTIPHILPTPPLSASTWPCTPPLRYWKNGHTNGSTCSDAYTLMHSHGKRSCENQWKMATPKPTTTFPQLPF